MPRSPRIVNSPKTPSTPAQRLRTFAVMRFGSVAALERAMGKGAGTLRSYLRVDGSKPGFEMLAELGRLGCDLQWFILGEAAMGSATATSPQELPIEALPKKSGKNATETVLYVAEVKRVDENLTVLYLEGGRRLVFVRRTRRGEKETQVQGR